MRRHAHGSGMGPLVTEHEIAARKLRRSRIKQRLGRALVWTVLSPLAIPALVCMFGDAVDEYMKRAKWPTKVYRTAQNIELWSLQ